MAQKKIDFGSYPNDPQSDSVRSAFQKVQTNFNQLFTGVSNAQVTAITAGAGISVSSPTGNVIIAANIACVQISTSTLGIGIGANNLSYAILTSSAQVLTIDIPANLSGITNLTLSGNLTTSGNATATYFIGDGSQLTGISTSSSSISNGTSNVRIPVASGNVNTSVGGTSNVLVVTTTGTNITGTFNTTGNANVGNLGTSGNITAGYFFGNGSQLTGISATVSGNSISNGTSNVSIPVASGNVNTSVGGTSNVFVVTSTGINIAGTLNATGNANVGNIGATTGVFTNISGTLTTASQTNITAVGTLGNLTVTSNVTAGNLLGIFANGTSNVKIPTASGNITLSSAGNSNILVITGTGANITGTANVSGNLSAGNANIDNILIVTSGSGGAITGANSITANYISTNLYTLYSVGTGIAAAGSTISAATVLAKQINIVTSVSSGQGVKLPVALTGMTLYITNSAANSLLVYPQVNSAINNLSANTAYTLSANTTVQILASTSTLWYTLGSY